MSISVRCFKTKSNMCTVYHDTTITYGKNPRTISLHNVRSISESKPTSGGPAQIHQNKCDIVEVELGDVTGECSKAYLLSSSAEMGRQRHLG